MLSVVKQNSSLLSNPPKIAAFLTDVTLLINYLDKSISVPKHPSSITVSDELTPTIKAIVTSQRRSLAATVEEQRDAFSDPGSRKTIESSMAPYDAFMNCDWFQESPLRTAPRPADFLTIQRVEEMQTENEKRRHSL